MNEYLCFTCIILIVYVSILILYKSRNKMRHKDSNSLYAHFSRIDRFNYVLFPSLLFTHPKKITLHAGQSLFIPKKWWHWVKTTERTFAINYWFINEEYKEPFTFHFTNNVDVSSLSDVQVNIWDSINDTRSINSVNFENFYNSKRDNMYIITVNDFDTGSHNHKLKESVKKYITTPDIVPVKFDYNVWVSSGKHDTGLHYDDEDGILNVVEGKKEIILFQPSDTPYLQPYRI